MALHWTRDARARIAARSLEDFKLRPGRYTDNWSWIRNPFNFDGWNALENPPETATDEQLQMAIKASNIHYTALFLGKQFGIDRVFSMLLSSKERETDKTLTPVIARDLVLHAGAKLKAITDAASEAWPAGDVVLHKTLAYAFFENDEWRHQALHEILKHEGFSHEALTMCRTEDEVRELLARREPKQSIEYCEIPAAIDEAGLAILMELAPKIRGNAAHLSHAYALSVYKDKGVAEHFAAHLSHPSTRTVISDYFERFRSLAEEALPAASKGASRNAALVKALYIKLGGVPAEEIEIAPADDPAIPEVLRDPPWKKKLAPAPKMAIDLAKYPRRVTLAPGAGDAALRWLEEQFKTGVPMTEEEKAAYLKEIESQTWVHDYVVNGKMVPLESILDTYNRGKRGRWQMVNEAMIAKFGDAALPGLLRETNAWSTLSPAILKSIDAPELAMPHAHQVVATAPGRSPWIWLDAQPRAAAYGLLATINDPAQHAIAEIVLRRLGRKHRDAVLSVAEKIGQRPWVTALLDRDPHLDFTAPQRVDLHPVTRARLKDGRGLPDKVLLHLYEMLSFSSLDEPYVGFEDVRAACDPKSLSDMSWDLAAAAEGTGRRRSQRNYSDWTRWSLVHFADDEVIRRLTPALKHASIYRALEALAVRGNRIAMMEIATADEREDPQGRSSMERIAERSGITVPELVETILPTTPLSEEGKTTLEYGKRQLEVGFDTTLSPFLFLDDKKLASLPRAKKTDDPIQVRLAKERWDELKEDVRTIARLRCKTLEEAIRTHRTIPAARFNAGWAHHPLGKHLARGMVWGVERDGKMVTFRVAEDSSLADVDDAAITLGDAEQVCVPHPLEIERTTLDRWSGVFVDYGLIQPIHQLGRTPLALNPGEESQPVISRPLTPGIPRSVIDRLLVEQGFQHGTRRVQGGSIFVSPTIDWGTRKRLATKVELGARDPNNQPVLLSTLQPGDRHEALFVIRLILEAT
jgi:hypothetical protein